MACECGVVNSKNRPWISPGAVFGIGIVMKGFVLCPLQAWQRPTLPRLKTKYHWRWGDLRPSSRWDRVWTPRQSHQAGEGQRVISSTFKLFRFLRIACPGRTLIMRAIKPIERLVPVSYGHCCPSTSGLSTWSSSTVLKGELVSRWVSRLDAFSGYPVHT